MEADVEDLQKQLMATLLPFQVSDAAPSAHMLTSIDNFVCLMPLTDYNDAVDRDVSACRDHLRRRALA